MDQTISASSDDQLQQIVEQLVQHALWEVESGTIAATPFTHLVYDRICFQAGDHLITPRTGYWHHGLYIGDGQVIHYSGGSDGAGTNLVHEEFNDFKVEKVDLNTFSQRQPIHIIEHTNPVYTSEEACSRAHSRLNEAKYSIAYRNCEHLVNWCIEGKERSGQIRRDLEFTGGVALNLSPPALKHTKQIIQTLGSKALAKAGLSKSLLGSAGINLSLTPTVLGALIRLGSAGLIVAASWQIVEEQMRRTSMVKKHDDQVHQARLIFEPILEAALQRFIMRTEQIIRQRQAQIQAAFHRILDENAPVDEQVQGLEQLLDAHGSAQLEHKNI